MGQRPQGFDYTVTADGTVRIRHRGKLATTLRGRRAADFLEDVDGGDMDGGDMDGGDAQLLMARVTGNYKRGNERVARNHPRNR